MTVEDKVNEDKMTNSIERGADRYVKKYGEYVHQLESKSILSRVRSVGAFDIYALGKQLEAFEEYKSFVEEDGSLAQLGKIPNVALDVITVTYGSSPISLFASTQPIEEERGIVYYKQLLAQTTKGNIVAGDKLFSSDGASKTDVEGYASDTTVEQSTVTVAGEKTYTWNVSQVPTRPEKLSIKIDGLNVYGKDDGNGAITGFGMYGSIDYNTGAVTIHVAADPGVGHAIITTSSLNYELASDLPRIGMRMTTKTVEAAVYALKDTVGLEQSYAMRKRFGLVAEDEIANDLVASINSEMCSKAIRKLSQASMGVTQWSKTPPAGVSYFEHKQTFTDSIAYAESVILGNAGRGTISVLVAGRNACSILSTLPGFDKISDGNTIGPHIYGTLNGVVVIRVPGQEILAANKILCLYNGASPFEAALVYAPYMPLVVTTSLPSGNNPLVNQKAAAVWAAIEALVPSFITTLEITA